VGGKRKLVISGAVLFYQIWLLRARREGWGVIAAF